MELPDCPKCKAAKMVPLSDYANQGSTVEYKAWACLNSECKHQVGIDRGAVRWGPREGQRD